MTCSNIDENFIIIKKEKIANPRLCISDTCSKRKVNGICACYLQVFNIRPHTFELIGAIRPFFEIVGISKLSFKELEHVVNHLEKILNSPIIEKNKQTYQRVIEMKKMTMKKRKGGDLIGRFRPKLLKK